VTNGVTGLTVPVRNIAGCLRGVDPADLANATLHMAEHKKLGKELGQKARQKAVDSYRIEVLVEATRAMYRQVMIKAGARVPEYRNTRELPKRLPH